MVASLNGEASAEAMVFGYYVGVPPPCLLPNVETPCAEEGASRQSSRALSDAELPLLRVAVPLGKMSVDSACPE
jgi:hypothetical protein